MGKAHVKLDWRRWRAARRQALRRRRIVASVAGVLDGWKSTIAPRYITAARRMNWTT